MIYDYLSFLGFVSNDQESRLKKSVRNMYLTYNTEFILLCLVLLHLSLLI